MWLEDLAYNLKWFFLGLLDKPLATLKKLWRQKTVKLAVSAAIIVLIIIPLVITLTAKAVFSPQPRQTTAGGAFRPDPIAAKDLFIPDKPDFLPPVMLERRQKEFWTSDDALEFWTAPSDFPDEFWRNKLSESIDHILEPLP
ncbi:MAG: hypothetical protein LBJ35_03170 [Spirochaetaceae bacterium]|jgi:hypothetical protein|nr:hypothetical protein [Spirochaetaceae bacterium]